MTSQAGTAVRDISPRTPMALFGYPHVERILTGIHDPLLASALCLRNGRSVRGSAAVILIALDLLQLEPSTARALRRAIAGQTKLPEDCVFISCTHTHSGPVTARLLSWQDDPAAPPPDPAYLEFVMTSVLEAAAEAQDNMRPAEHAWTTAEARGVGGNRLAPDGVTDPEAGILAVREAGGGPLLAAVLIYGMHPTVLHEDSTLVSADFPHYARLQLRERFGEALTVLYHTAPCGNQSPRYFVRGQTFAEAERLGRKLGRAVAASLEQLRPEDFSSDCALAGALQKVALPRRPLLSVAAAEKQLAEYRGAYDRLQAENAGHGPVRTAECAIFGAEGALALAQAQARGELDQELEVYNPSEVQVLRIGAACLAGLPGELFTEYALALKEKAPGKVFVLSLVNGDLQGYIVTPETARAGGYEANTSLFAPESGGLLVKAAVKLIGKL